MINKNIFLSEINYLKKNMKNIRFIIFLPCEVFLLKNFFYVFTRVTLGKNN